MNLPELTFSEQQLTDFVTINHVARRALLDMLESAIDTALDRFAGAPSDRQAAICQGEVLAIQGLRDAVRGAPERFDALARKEKRQGTSPSTDGFL